MMKLRRNWQAALLALSLALIIWYFILGREKVDAWLELPIQLSGMPEELIVREGLLSRVDVRIRGPKGLVRGLDPKTLAYALNLSGIKVGFNAVQFIAQGVPLPKTFEVVAFIPSRLQLVVDRKESKIVPIVPVWKGNIDPDYVLLESQVIPEMVTVKGPEKVVREIVTVETQLIDIKSSRPDLIEEQVALNLPDEVESEMRYTAVRLIFGIKTRDLILRLPVALPTLPGRTIWLEPEHVKLVVAMPLPLARDREVGRKIVARVVLPPTLPAGRHELPITVALPQGCRQLSLDPVKVLVVVGEQRD